MKLLTGSSPGEGRFHASCPTLRKVEPAEVKLEETEKAWERRDLRRNRKRQRRKKTRGGTMEQKHVKLFCFSALGLCLELGGHHGESNNGSLTLTGILIFLFSFQTCWPLLPFLWVPRRRRLRLVASFGASVTLLSVSPCGHLPTREWITFSFLFIVH